MGLYNSFREWKANKYEEKIAKMESKGICPECYGKGINSLALNEFYVTNVFDCPGCNGSGLFTDWSENNQ